MIAEILILLWLVLTGVRSLRLTVTLLGLGLVWPSGLRRVLDRGRRKD